MDLNPCPRETSDAAHALDTPRKCGCRRIAWVLGSIAAFFVVLWLFRESALTGAARAWIVDQPLARADAVLVLGGGLDQRPFAAAELYHRGWATNILVPRILPSPADALGVTEVETDTIRRVLLKKGVPESAITLIGTNVSSTFEECLAAREWARQHSATRIIIPTDLFHTRRVNWLFEKHLASAGTRPLVRAVVPFEYGTTNWWRHEAGLIGFQNEVIKYGFYRYKY